MTDALNTVSAILSKRTEIAGNIEHHQTMLRLHITDLDNLDGTIRLFEPNMDLAEVRPRPFPPRHTAFKGEVARIILASLKESPGPMTAQQLAMHFMAERGLNAADKRLVRTIGKRIWPACGTIGTMDYCGPLRVARMGC